MNTPSYRAVRSTRLDLLLEDLADPFASFPVGGAAGSIQAAINAADEAFQERMRSTGAARKCWDVPSELLHEEIGVLLGAGFLLGQTVLNQALALLRHIRHLDGLESAISKKKVLLFRLQECLSKQDELSRAEIVDHAANYFKHHEDWAVERSYPDPENHDEWTETWTCDKDNSQQHVTIQGCTQMGMSPGSVTDNLRCALRALGGQGYDIGQIQRAAWDWREQLAKHLYAKQGLANP